MASRLHGPGGRPADPPAARAGRQHRQPRDHHRDPHRSAPPEDHRSRSGRRPCDHRADPRHARSTASPRTTGLGHVTQRAGNRSTTRRATPIARQKAFGSRSPPVPTPSRTRDAAGGPTRPHRARVVRLGPGPRAARRCHRRGRRGLDADRPLRPGHRGRSSRPRPPSRSTTCPGDRGRAAESHRDDPDGRRPGPGAVRMQNMLFRLSQTPAGSATRDARTAKTPMSCWPLGYEPAQIAELRAAEAI